MADEVITGTMYHKHYHDRDRNNDNCLDEMTANGVQRLQHDVADLSGKIGDKINAAMAQDNANARSADQMVCGMERNLAEGQREVEAAVKDSECSLGKQISDLRFEGAKTESKLIERMNHESDQLKEKISNFERSVDKQFCDIKESGKDSERRILERLTLDKLDEKNDEIARLRANCDRRDLEIAIERNNVAFSSQLQLVNSQLIDLAQAQKATNTAINFGTGLIGQAATQNQVR